MGAAPAAPPASSEGCGGQGAWRLFDNELNLANHLRAKLATAYAVWTGLSAVGPNDPGHL